MALIVKSDVWYSIDLNKALTSLGVPAATINIVDSAVGGNTAKAMDTLKSAYQTEGDTDIDTIIVTVRYIAYIFQNVKHIF